MPAAGRLQGLEGLRQGLGLDLLPYVVGNSSAAPGPRQLLVDRNGSARRRRRLQRDARPSRQPVDQHRLRRDGSRSASGEPHALSAVLSREARVLPRRRERLRRSRARPGNSIVPFFSRRIGLDDSGVPQPVDYGAKLTGHAGAFDVGVAAGADARSRRRRRRGLHGAAIAAAILAAVVRRRALHDTQRRGCTGATDGRRRLRVRDVAVSSKEVLEVSGFYLNTTKLPGSRGGAAFGARINMPNDPFTGVCSCVKCRMATIPPLASSIAAPIG